MYEFDPNVKPSQERLYQIAKDCAIAARIDASREGFETKEQKYWYIKGHMGDLLIKYVYTYYSSHANPFNTSAPLDKELDEIQKAFQEILKPFS